MPNKLLDGLNRLGDLLNLCWRTNNKKQINTSLCHNRIPISGYLTVGSTLASKMLMWASMLWIVRSRFNLLVTWRGHVNAYLVGPTTSLWQGWCTPRSWSIGPLVGRWISEVSQVLWMDCKPNTVSPEGHIHWSLHVLALRMYKCRPQSGSCTV